MGSTYDKLGELFSFGTGSYDRTRQNALNYAKESYDFEQLKGNDAAVKAQVVSDLGVAPIAPASAPQTAVSTPTQAAMPEQPAASPEQPQAATDARVKPGAPTDKQAVVQQLATPPSNPVTAASAQGISPQATLTGLKTYADEQEYLAKNNRVMADMFARNGDSRGYERALKNSAASNAEMAGTRATAEATQAAMMKNIGQAAQAANLDPSQYPNLKRLAKSFGYELPDRFDQKAVDAMVKQGMDTHSAGALTQAGAQLEVQKQIAQMEQQYKNDYMKLQLLLSNRSREGIAPDKETMKIISDLQTKGVPKDVKERLGVVLKNAGLDGDSDTNKQYALNAVQSRMVQKVWAQAQSGQPDMTLNWNNTLSEVAAEMAGNTKLERGKWGFGDMKPGVSPDGATTQLPGGLSSTVVVNPDTGALTATFKDKSGATRARTFSSTEEYNAAIKALVGDTSAASNRSEFVKDTPQGQRKVTAVPLPNGNYRVTITLGDKQPTTQEVTSERFLQWKKKEGWEPWLNGQTQAK